MKKKSVIMAAIAIAVAVLAMACLPVVMEYTRSESSDEEVMVEIPVGASDKVIASVLKDAGVIKHEISFRLKMRSSPYRGQLNYGTYSMYKNMCLDDIVDMLSKPSTVTDSVKFTIPEGYSAEMIALRCEKMGICKAEDFLRELEEGDFDYAFISDIPENKNVKYKLQGYLFPSTYLFDRSSDAHKVIDTLLKEFEKQYNSVKHLLPEGMDMNSAVIRASLIEREAKIDSERELISGVIQNRLDIGMKLQIDACVAYVISDGLYDVTRVLYKDLEAESPYNTYKYEGLPAGAICNPGIASIRAAMKPYEHKYLYYHTDTDKNDGSHIFSETYAQHKK